MKINDRGNTKVESGFQRLDYLTGAKGIACLIVSFNHFIVFWPANKPFPVMFLINGTYMLFLFYFLSAFLFGLDFFGSSLKVGDRH